jgi:8-oxo-dGTP diphosphatase
MFPIHVAVGVIQNPEGKILLTRRQEHTHQGGLWEFPGGKVERREDLSQALRREIREELGIEVITHQPLISITHAYPEKTVRLDVHSILKYAGVPYGMEGQPLEWVSIQDLDGYSMPAADRPICNALKLPDAYLITGPDPKAVKPFLRTLEASLDQDIKLVQLRAPGLSDDEYRALSASVYKLCQQYGAKMMANVSLDLINEIEADGFHLTSLQLNSLSDRPVSSEKWLSASCHSQRELVQAAALGVDFCVLSPVLATASHPEAVPLGWDQFSQHLKPVNMPVYALGGMDRKHIAQAKMAGGQGIAAISALWAQG